MVCDAQLADYGSRIYFLTISTTSELVGKLLDTPKNSHNPSVFMRTGTPNEQIQIKIQQTTEEAKEPNDEATKTHGPGNMEASHVARWPRSARVRHVHPGTTSRVGRGVREADQGRPESE